MRTVGYLLGTTIGLICLAINDYRYAAQLSTVWYICFLAFCFAFWVMKKQRKTVSIFLLFAGLTLLAYFNSFPQFTYKQAVLELSNVYSEESFAPVPNMKCQNMAPRMKDGGISYYCYVMESNGKIFFFDQHTGLYGRVTTDPGNVP